MPSKGGENLMKKTILVGLLALIIAPETLGATNISKSEAYTLCKQKVINAQNASRVKLKKIRESANAYNIHLMHYTPAGRQKTLCTINKKEYEVLLSSLL